MTKRMLIMLALAGLVFGGIFGFQIFKGQMMKKYMAMGKPPPATVTTKKVEFEIWQAQMNSVGSLRAARGVDVTTEIAGQVRAIHFNSGQGVSSGQLLLELNAEAEIAQLRALESAAELAQLSYERDQAQYAAQAISKAQLDTDAANLKTAKAQVAQQAALVAKKSIRAPFAGQLGITTVQPGQYLNTGDKIVTLQQNDPIFVDFSLPQQQLPRLKLGQKVSALVDAYPGRSFAGKLTTIDPKVDPNTRNLQLEAAIANHKRELLPGMFAQASVNAGGEQRYLTVPQTAISFNPYGATIFVVQEPPKDGGKDASKGGGKDGNDGAAAGLTVKQVFVNTGETRGDQVAVLSGLKEGDVVVTSGQLKLRNGSAIVVSNSAAPSNDAAPKPVDQ
jgi:membrane fusion protein (multidrug efflux system)